MRVPIFIHDIWIFLQYREVFCEIQKVMDVSCHFLQRTIQQPVTVTTAGQIWARSLMRKSSIVFLQMFGGWPRYLIASLPTRSDTLVFEIERHFGTINFAGNKGLDVFDTEDEAIAFVSQGYKIDKQIQAVGILGYAFSVGCTSLFLVKQAQPIFTIFKKHCIYAVSEVEVIDSPTLFDQDLATDCKDLRSFPFAQGHFYCPTFDLGKLIGKNMHDARFLWNHALTAQFDKFQIPGLSIDLFQGTVCGASFSDFGFDALLMCHRAMPSKQSIAVRGLVEDVPFHDYEVDLIMLRSLGRGCEVFRHKLKVGDVPFQWKFVNDEVVVGEDSMRNTESFLNKQLAGMKIQKLFTVNHMDGKSNEAVLMKEFEKIMKTKPGLMTVVSIDGREFRAFDDKKMESFWNMKVAPILQECEHAELWIEEGKEPVVRREQNGACRYVIGNRFEGGLVSLFFYLLKSFEYFANEPPFEADIHLMNSSVIRAKYGAISSFITSFALKFGELLNNFGLLLENAGLYASQIVSLDPSNPTFTSEKKMMPRTFEKLLDLKRLSITCVTSSPSAFVVSKNILGTFLSRNSKKQYVPQNLPIDICLSEPCYLRDIVFQPATVTNVSIWGGLWLNRMFPIVEGLSIIPNVANRYSVRPQTDQKYDQSVKCTDWEPIRFLRFVFTSIVDPAAVTTVHVFGIHKKPNLPKRQNSGGDGSTQSRIEDDQPIVYEGAYSPDNVFLWEEKRLLGGGDIGDYYEQMVRKGKKLDLFDIDYLMEPHNPEIAHRKTVCENPKCAKKEMCMPCWGCQKMFCQKCLFGQPKKILCENCQCQQKRRLQLCQKLKLVRLKVMQAMYPFIAYHGDIRQLTSQSNPSFDRIDRIPIAWTLYELPKGKNGVRIEQLFNPKRGEQVCWCPETNLVVVHLALCTECKIDRIAIDCDYPTEVTVTDGCPSKLEFEAPGGTRACSIQTRVIVLRINSEKISLRRIGVFGNPVTCPHCDEPESVPTGIPSLMKVSVKQGKFNKTDNAHELEYPRAVAVSGIRFRDLGVIGKFFVVECRNGQDVRVFHCELGAVLSKTKKTVVFLPQIVRAVNIKIWYKGLTPAAVHALANDKKCPLAVTFES